MAFVPLVPLRAGSSMRGAPLACPSHVDSPAHAAQTQRRPAQIEMKKARFHQPMRPKEDTMKIPEDGTPIFSIFVRSPRSKIWFPLASFGGDDRSKTLVNALKSGFGKAMYQNSLDKGIAQTVFGRDKGRLLQTAVRQYPQLKRSAGELEFGYKISAKDLEDAPTRVVTADMALAFLPWAKKQLDNALGGK